MYNYHCFLKQSNEVDGAYHCELEGLKRSMDVIGAEHVSVLVTDRHRGITKWIRDNLPDILHYYDVWHVAKGMMSNNIVLNRFLLFCLCLIGLMEDTGKTYHHLFSEKFLMISIVIFTNMTFTNMSFLVFCIGIGKKIKAASKAKGCEDLGQWKQSIVNHVYWSAGSSEGRQ